MSMMQRQTPERFNPQDFPYEVVAELREINTPEGRVWQFVSRSAEIADHAWIERHKFHQFSNGAKRLDVCWEEPDGNLVISTHQPRL